MKAMLHKAVFILLLPSSSQWPYFPHVTVIYMHLHTFLVWPSLSHDSRLHISDLAWVVQVFIFFYMAVTGISIWGHLHLRTLLAAVLVWQSSSYGSHSHGSHLHMAAIFIYSGRLRIAVVFI